jgi:hypothetical protein
MHVEDKHNIVTHATMMATLGAEFDIKERHGGTLRGRWVRLSHTYLGLFCIDGV